MKLAPRAAVRSPLPHAFDDTAHIYLVLVPILCLVAQTCKGRADSVEQRMRPAGFANEAQFLLINAESVREVSRRVAAKAALHAEEPITAAQPQVGVWHVDLAIVSASGSGSA